MKNKYKDMFNGYEVVSIIWRNKPCWIAVNIAQMLGYTEYSYAISSCLDREKFRVGIEHEILKGEELKEFKKLLGNEISKAIKYAPKLIIFYEPGLYGFLQYTEKPLGVTFRTWIREEVVPQIRATGAYVLDYDYYEKTYNSDIEFTCGNYNNVSRSDSMVNPEVIIKDNNLNRSSEVKVYSKNVVEKIADNVIIFDKYLDGLSIADEDKFLFLVSLYKSASIDIDLGFINSNKL
ncbi:MAG: BRO-N domain-containing protein [Sarcina sp.]